MRKRVFRKVGHDATLFFHNIVFGCLSFGNTLIGKIRHGQKQVGHLLLALCETVLKSGGLSLDARHFRLGCLCFILLSLLHQSAYRLRQFVDLRGVRFGLLLKTATLGVNLQNLGYDGSPVKALDGETADDKLRISLYNVKL